MLHELVVGNVQTSHGETVAWEMRTKVKQARGCQKASMMMPFCHAARQTGRQLPGGEQVA